MRKLNRYLTIIGVSVAIFVSAIAPSFADCACRRDSANIFRAVIRQFVCGRHDNSYRMRSFQRDWRNDRRDRYDRYDRRDARGRDRGCHQGCRR